MPLPVPARLRLPPNSISRNARLFLWMVFLSNIGVSGIFLLLYNLYLVALGYNEDFIGVLSFVQTGAIALGAIPSGSMADRFGCKNVLLLGTIILASSSVGLCLFTEPAPLIVLNLLAGAGFAMRIIPYTPYLVNNTDRKVRTLVFSANSAAISIAGTAGSIIGGQLPSLFSRLLSLPPDNLILIYRPSLLAGALIGLLAAVPMALASEKTEMAAEVSLPPQGTISVRHSRVAGRREIAIFITTTALFAFSSACISPFSNVFFDRVLGMSAAAISIVFSASSILAAIATLAASSIANRIGKVRAMVGIRIAGVPGLILLALHPILPVAALAIPLRNMTEMAGWPLDGAFLAEVIPIRRQARTVAYRSIAWNGTWALTAFLAGQAIIRAGYRPLFLASAIMLALASTVYYLAFWRLETDSDEKAKV